MTLASSLLCLAAMAMVSVTSVASPLWNGISIGQAAETVTRQVFVDARGISHVPSHHAMVADFYLQPDNPAIVRILYRGKPRRVCGVDIEGTRAALEREALLTELGPPASRVTEVLLNSPGGSAALLSGGKLFRIWTWHQGSTVITFKERIRPGYFAILYRGTDAAGRKVDC